MTEKRTAQDRGLGSQTLGPKEHQSHQRSPERRSHSSGPRAPETITYDLTLDSDVEKRLRQVWKQYSNPHPLSFHEFLRLVIERAIRGRVRNGP